MQKRLPTGPAFIGASLLLVAALCLTVLQSHRHDTQGHVQLLRNFGTQEATVVTTSSYEAIFELLPVGIGGYLADSTTRITEIVAEGCGWSDDEVEVACNHSTITRLILGGNRITDKSLIPISRLDSLEQLSLAEPQVT
ncbi:MAG: hypothetical protein O3B68_22335, partial [Planctomycetota bacterium]|nr:hypothetical protein [Planctomycetota bacterium]